MKILQIVGYKNTGKTTLLCQVITALHAQGYRVGAIKHHGHNSPLTPITPTENMCPVDNHRFLQAGALLAATCSPTETQCIGENGIINTRHHTFSELLSIYKAYNIDILLLEGFKHFDYPKVLLTTNNEMPPGLSHVIATLQDKERVPETILHLLTLL